MPYGYRDNYRALRLSCGPGYAVMEWDDLSVGGCPGWYPVPDMPTFATRPEAQRAARAYVRAMHLNDQQFILADRQFFAEARRND